MKWLPVLWVPACSLVQLPILSMQSVHLVHWKPTWRQIVAYSRCPYPAFAFGVGANVAEPFASSGDVDIGIVADVVIVVVAFAAVA